MENYAKSNPRQAQIYLGLWGVQYAPDGHGSQYASVSISGIIDIFTAVDCNQTSLKLRAWTKYFIFWVEEDKNVAGLSSCVEYTRSQTKIRSVFCVICLISSQSVADIIEVVVNLGS